MRSGQMVQVSLDEKALTRAKKILDSLPDEIAVAAYDEGLKAAAKVVQKEAKARAPRGDRSRQLQSMSKSRYWSPVPLNKLIRIKMLGRGLRKGSRQKPAALVGAKSPDGNQINFVHPTDHSSTKIQKYWGKDARTAAPQLRKTKDFLKRAADTTKQQQVRAFTRAIIPAIRKRMTRLKKRG